MGFSKPKAIPPTPSPPPVRQTAEDVQAAKEAERKKQAGRSGYAATLISGNAPMPDTTGKKTLLGGP